MIRPASRLIELNTWSGPMRSSSSTGGTTTTMMRRELCFGVAATGSLCRRVEMRCNSSFAARRTSRAPCRNLTDPCRKSTDLSPIAWNVMNHRFLCVAFAALASVVPAIALPQSGQTVPTKPDVAGPFARIAFLRPHDGDTVDFEAGYLRHLDFHRQARDTWSWYGWTIWAGELQRWFVYATFGHSAASLDNPVPPADDERDNISNVTPHAEFAGNGLFEFLPALSRGTGAPTPTARLEFTTVDLNVGAGPTFEAAVATRQAAIAGETLWYRMVAGGRSPRYVCLRPRTNLQTLLDGTHEPLLPDAANASIARMTTEILNFRPTMSYGVGTK